MSAGCCKSLHVRSNGHRGTVLLFQRDCSVFVHGNQFVAFSFGYGTPCAVFFVVYQVNSLTFFSFLGNGVAVFVGTYQVFTVFALYGFDGSYFGNRIGT